MAKPKQWMVTGYGTSRDIEQVKKWCRTHRRDHGCLPTVEYTSEDGKTLDVTSWMEHEI